MAFGGSPPTTTVGLLTEKYDGTSWTGGGNMNTGRRYLAGAGTQTAGLAFGGEYGGVPVANNTEEFNSPGFTINTLTTT